MTTELRRILKENHMYLIENLTLNENLVTKLVEKNVISTYDVIRIAQTDDPFEANTRFLHILYDKPMECYQKFLDSLIEGGQGKLAETIMFSKLIIMFSKVIIMLSK